jgi:hypothetical protein
MNFFPIFFVTLALIIIQVQVVSRPLTGISDSNQFVFPDDYHPSLFEEDAGTDIDSNDVFLGNLFLFRVVHITGKGFIKVHSGFPRMCRKHEVYHNGRCQKTVRDIMIFT